MYHVNNYCDQIIIYIIYFMIKGLLINGYYNEVRLFSMFDSRFDVVKILSDISAATLIFHIKNLVLVLTYEPSTLNKNSKALELLLIRWSSSYFIVYSLKLICVPSKVSEGRKFIHCSYYFQYFPTNSF